MLVGRAWPGGVCECSGSNSLQSWWESRTEQSMDARLAVDPLWRSEWAAALTLALYNWHYPIMMAEPKKSDVTKLGARRGQITFRPHSDLVSNDNTQQDSNENAKLPLLEPLPSSSLPKKRSADSQEAEEGAKTPKMARVANSNHSASAKSCCVQNLPCEILAIVFRHLDFPARRQAALVCRGWREILYLKSIWRGNQARLHLRRPLHSSLYSALVRRGIRHVQILSLRKSFRDVVHHISKLKSLSLSGCFNLSNSALDIAFRRSCGELLHLDLSLCKEISEQGLLAVANSCCNLQQLDLAGCSRVSNASLKIVASKLRQLKRLNLRSCRLVSDQGIQHLCNSNLALEELCLQDCQLLSDQALRHLAEGMKGLSKLNLSFCVSITDTGLKSLAAMANLRDLNLRSCDNVSDLGVGFLAETSCSSLASLDLSFCTNVSDTGVQHIAKGIRGLEKLLLASCSLTDAGLAALAKNLRNLQTLSIGQCAEVTNRGVRIIEQELAGTLTRLDLYGCAKVDQQSIRSIRSMPGLRQLNLQLHMNA